MTGVRGSRDCGGPTRVVLLAVLALPFLAVLLHTLIRIVRYYYKFPMPGFLAELIDNPFRRWMQPPDAMALRHKLEPGMSVLEVGPGSGTYTMAAARRVGATGRLVSVDINPKMVRRVGRKAEAEGVVNVDARVADVYDLPFEDGAFDAAYMIAVLGEIPEPERAMTEFRRVLAPGGTLAFSELLMDPDYILASRLVGLAEGAGFRPIERLGTFFCYTLIFV